MSPSLPLSPPLSSSHTAAENNEKTGDNAIAVAKEKESDKKSSATSEPPTTGECVHMFL